MELAQAVVEACAATRADPTSSFKLLYPSEASIKVRREGGLRRPERTVVIRGIFERKGANKTKGISSIGRTHGVSTVVSGGTCWISVRVPVGWTG